MSTGTAELVFDNVRVPKAYVPCVAGVPLQTAAHANAHCNAAVKGIPKRQHFRHAMNWCTNAGAGAALVQWCQRGIQGWGGGGQGTWAARTRKRSEAGCGRPEDGGVWTAKTVQRPPQQPAQPPRRQLLGAADAQTAHPATSGTAPAHQTTGLRKRGNDTSKSTGRSSRQKAATRRNMRREERGTFQGPVKKRQPDGVSHGGTSWRDNFGRNCRLFRKAANFAWRNFGVSAV